MDVVDYRDLSDFAPDPSLAGYTFGNARKAVDPAGRVRLRLRSLAHDRCWTSAKQWARRSVDWNSRFHLGRIRDVLLWRILHL